MGPDEDGTVTAFSLPSAACFQPYLQDPHTVLQPPTRLEPRSLGTRVVSLEQYSSQYTLYSPVFFPVYSLLPSLLWSRLEEYPGDPPDSVTEPTSLASPALAGGDFAAGPMGSPTEHLTSDYSFSRSGAHV